MNTNLKKEDNKKQPEEKVSKIEKLLEDKKNHDIRVEKLNKLKASYEQLQNGQLNNEKFIETIKKDIGEENSKKVSELFGKANSYGVTFQEVLNNTDILEHRKTEKKVNVDYDPKHNLYKREQKPIIPVTQAPKNEYNSSIKNATQKFVKGEMDSDNYTQILQSEGINTNSGEIQKLINQKNEIDDVSYQDVMNALNFHKNDTFDSTKIEIKKGKDCAFREDTGVESEKSLMMHRKGEEDKYIPLKKKKQYFNGNVNVFQSDKNLFDWDLSALNAYNPEQGKKIQAKNESRIHAKNLDLTKKENTDDFNNKSYCKKYKNAKNNSTVFNKDVQVTEPIKTRRTINTKNTSQIFNNFQADTEELFPASRTRRYTKGNESHFILTDQILPDDTKPRPMKKSIYRNKNTSNILAPDEPIIQPRKVNYHLKTSEENPLNFSCSDAKK